jgi:hypothetical protein
LFIIVTLHEYEIFDLPTSYYVVQLRTFFTVQAFVGDRNTSSCGGQPGYDHWLLLYPSTSKS